MTKNVGKIVEKPLSDVICDQCGLCCQLFLINLNEKEYSSRRYETVFGEEIYFSDFEEATENGAIFLKQQPDGSCIYLREGICSIHVDRPAACRDFFCKGNEREFLKMKQEVNWAKTINVQKKVYNGKYKRRRSQMDERNSFDAGEPIFSHRADDIIPPRAEPEDIDDGENREDGETLNPVDVEISRLKEFNVEVPSTATFKQLFETVKFYSGEKAAHDAEIMADFFLRYCKDQLDIPGSLDDLKGMKMSELVKMYPNTLTIEMIEDFLPVIFD